MELKIIGYWKSSLADDYPLPQEVEIDFNPAIRDRLVAYLKAGSLFETYRGTSRCRYGCPGPNGYSELWDGTWVWPDGLAHYVCEHRVGLPPDFLRHACDPERTRPPDLPRREIVDGIHVDESYWVAWGRTYRTPGVDRLLREASERATTRCNSILQADAARIARERGLGEEECIKFGCSDRIAAGMAYCPRCLAELDRGLIARHAAHDELAKVWKGLAREPGSLAPPENSRRTTSSG